MEKETNSAGMVWCEGTQSWVDPLVLDAVEKEAEGSIADLKNLLAR